jgi:hypothetical protein
LKYYGNRGEIMWKYNRNNPSLPAVGRPTCGNLGEIGDSIRISMVFHESARCGGYFYRISTVFLFPELVPFTYGF